MCWILYWLRQLNALLSRTHARFRVRSIQSEPLSFTFNKKHVQQYKIKLRYCFRNGLKSVLLMLLHSSFESFTEASILRKGVSFSLLLPSSFCAIFSHHTISEGTIIFKVPFSTKGHQEIFSFLCKNEQREIPILKDIRYCGTIMRQTASFAHRDNEKDPVPNEKEYGPNEA